MTGFTPISALAGGAMIGLAAVLLMACHGRIAGMTGIISGLLPPFPVRDRGWRAAFLLGAIGSPIAIGLVQAGPIPMQVDAKPLLLVLGGFIVGIGVTLGSGCTSGHGVCGLARLSPRSLVATLVFMASTALTVFAIRHVIGG